MPEKDGLQAIQEIEKLDLGVRVVALSGYDDADLIFRAMKLGKKANAADVEAKLVDKADKSYVDTELGKKANAADVNAELVKKANATDVYTSAAFAFLPSSVST